MALERRGVRIRGVVQGVGFRPAMYRHAAALGLGGFVRNDAEGVWLEIEGIAPAVQRFVDEIAAAAPPASRIDAVEAVPLGTRGDRDFAIAQSVQGAEPTAGIPADLAPCADCLRELGDPHDRRAGYPFINCTACGPRFTIVREVPYDRAKTTMTAFAMCDACRDEYEDPADRRFHAEPNACWACGPRVWIHGSDYAGAAAIIIARQALASGSIVAIKGVGGYALAVDATNEAAVARLRARKRRPHKPFAVMARSLAELDTIARVDGAARKLLASQVRPIVLAPAILGTLAPSVAPGLADVGVFLPPTPLQLLVAPGLVVMTSGNSADEPIARTDDEALRRLADIADVFVVHDRVIHARNDDSVVRASAAGVIPIRRSRGFVPDVFSLPVAGPPVIAVGGHERNTVCLAHRGTALVSQHVGDLDGVEAEAFFREAIDHLCELAGVAPVAVAHDLHPDYRSTRWALASGLPRVAVQHHHAHVAACLAEHGRIERAIGVAFDGTGLGADGTLWGGEILVADLRSARRVGHLRPIALPGGEIAIRQPWRLALAAVLDAGQSTELVCGVERWRRSAVERLVDVAPRATSAGRWFDAVAALLGVRTHTSYDGQAAAELEAIASPANAGRAAPPEAVRRSIAGSGGPLDYAIGGGDPFEIDLRPTIAELARGLHAGADMPLLAARFHTTLAAAIAAACRRVRAASSLATVVLTGGCFQNRILVETTAARLDRDGFEVLVHRRIPANDGGLALGQVAIASLQLEERHVPGRPG
jgi:hydrogenase maturation protein HypF